MNEYRMYIQGKYFNFNFDKTINIPFYNVDNYILLLFELSDNDIINNMLYYISNKNRFDYIYEIPIDKIFMYIDKHFINFESSKLDRFKLLIKQNYYYIPILQNIYNTKSVEYWDDYLLV